MWSKWTRRCFRRAKFTTVWTTQCTSLLDVSMFRDERIFDEIQFIDYFRYTDVELDELYDFLSTRVPWVRPRDTGRSTNCLINEAGIYVHQTGTRLSQLRPALQLGCAPGA